MKRFAVALILFLAFCGLADSAYITQQEISGAPLLCNIENLSGCNIVAQSSYSHILGISLSEYGMLFYGLIFVIAAVELALYRPALRRLIQTVAVLGVLSSLYFTFLQVFVINALCIYCLGSALIAVALLVLAGFIEPVRTQRMQKSAATSEGAQPQRAPFTMPPAA